MQVVRNPQLTPPLRSALIELWATVANAGGAVGFLSPTSSAQVSQIADPAFARVAQGTDDLVVAFDGDRPVGFGFLVTNDITLARHWATVKRLQRDPEYKGRGVGLAILRELEATARDRGLSMVMLTVRGGTGREAFYQAHGYRLDARLPARLRLADGTLVDELHLSKSLHEADERIVLPVRRLDRALPLPGYARLGDAGLDLVARETVTVNPGERALIPTGVAVAIPEGRVGLVHPRSGLAARHGVALVNAPGTIDAGYRGEIKVIVINLDPAEATTLARGERIAQLVVQPVDIVRVVEVDVLPESARGESGFGSTGR